MNSLLDDLTRRERDVLELMARGYTNRAIADELHLSNASIEKHSARVFRKLNLSADPSRNPRVMAALCFYGVHADTRVVRRTASLMFSSLVVGD